MDRTTRARVIRAVLVTLCVVIALTLTAAGLGYGLSMRVDGRSMAPTLADGERVLTNPFEGDYTPARLDVVVLAPPGREAPVVKRVIGLPGDQVRASAGRIMVRPGGSGPWLAVVTTATDPWGRPPRECCDASGRGGKENGTADGEETAATVPPGQLWVVGDNPGVSEDSREYGWVPVERVKARLWVRLWPLGEVNAEPELRPLE